MAHPKVKISDNSGNTVGVTDNKLDVNLEFDPANIDIGDVEILGHGSITPIAKNLTGSASQLGGLACKHVDIMANLSNVGIAYIGATDAVDATSGIALYAGDVYSLDIANTNLLWVFSTNSGDDLNILAFI